MFSLMKLFKPRHWLFLNRLVSTPTTTTLFTLSEYTSHTNTVSMQCCVYSHIHCKGHGVPYAYMVRIHQSVHITRVHCLCVHFQSTSVLRLLLEFEYTVACTSPGYITVCTFSEYITVVSLLSEFEYTAACNVTRVHNLCVHFQGTPLRTYCQSTMTMIIMILMLTAMMMMMMTMMMMSMMTTTVIMMKMTDQRWSPVLPHWQPHRLLSHHRCGSHWNHTHIHTKP